MALGLGNLFTSANVGICRESQISSEISNTNIGLYITPKQPFEISNSKNDIKKSPSALHLEKYRRVPKFVKKETKKCNPLKSLATFIHKIGLNFDNFKEQYERNWTENSDNNKHLTISKNRLHLAAKSPICFDHNFLTSIRSS